MSTATFQKKQMAFYFPATLQKKLKKRAFEEEKSMTSLIIEAVEEFLKKKYETPPVKDNSEAIKKLEKLIFTGGDKNMSRDIDSVVYA